MNWYLYLLNTIQSSNHFIVLPAHTTHLLQTFDVVLANPLKNMKIFNKIAFENIYIKSGEYIYNRIAFENNQALRY